MKTVSKRLSLITRLSITAAALLFGQQAFAVGTDAGTSISNTVDVTYDVGGVNQGTVNPASPAVFVVDRRVDFTVTRLGTGLTPIGLSESDAFLDFYVTNISNDTLDFELVATQLTAAFGEIYPPGPGTADTTDPTEDVVNVRIRVASASFDPGVTAPGSATAPTLADGTRIDDLAEDQAIRVRIYVDGPTATANGEVSGLSLDAVASDDAGTPLTEDPDTALGVENVFADAGEDNSESAADGFVINTAALTITKTATVFSDPFNGTTNPLAIPGALITYTITLANSGGQSADDISILDNIDANVTFLTGANNITINDGTTDTFCTADGSGTDAADGCTWDSTTRDLTVAPPTLDVGASETWTVTFQVEIPL